MKKYSAQELYDELLAIDFQNSKGEILFNLAGVSVKIDTTDTVGITLQAWLKQYMIDHDIYFSEPENTQAFPDFYLNDVNKEENMLEVKAFNYNATPAFDIANFESYCASVKEKPFRLGADYIIFGYVMEENGDIHIEKIWLHKIWEIAGTSKTYPLKTQIKRDVIYNIRPNSEFKLDKKGPFKSKEEFLNATYETLYSYRGDDFASEWAGVLSDNYRSYFGKDWR